MEIAANRPAPTSTGLSPDREKILREKSQELEATFLSEMLSYTGLNETSDFAGGTGESQFSSFLGAEQAKAIVAKGGIGLAESIFKALAQRDETTS
jgi:Rod binding domain-containing protein